MEISAEKTKLMRNKDDVTRSCNHSQWPSTTDSQPIQIPSGSKPEILARTALTTAALAKLQPVWKDKNITVGSKLRLLNALVLSIFHYACESWTLTAELQRKIQDEEMRSLRRLLGISYKDHITNEEVRRRVSLHMKKYVDRPLS